MSTSSEFTDQQGPGGGEAALAISNAIVTLLRTHAGRGPTRAKATIRSDFVMVVLRDCLTTGEKTLAAAGEEAIVRRTREVLHRNVCVQMVATVEAATGKRVEACLADQHHDPDVAVLAFILENGAE